MQALPPIKYYDLSGGLASYVSDDLLPPNTATLSINLNYDVLGDVTQRNGTAITGLQVLAGNGCDGIGQFITSNQAINKLVASFGGSSYAYDGSSWSNVGGATSAGTAVRYTSFLNRFYQVGGGASTYSWTGSSVFGVVAGAPSGKYIIPYKQRLYIAGDPNYPNRLWFSTIATFAGAISWDTSVSSIQYIDFTQGKANDVITGLGKISNLLIIFLNNAMYRWNASSTDAEIVVDIGCSSQESIVNAKGALYFFNPTGFYVTDSTYPQEISRPINDWVQAISPSNYSKIYGGSDADHIYWFVGDVTLTKAKRGTSRTFSNVCLVYTISSRNWQIYSYANNLRFMATYVDTTNAVRLVSGDTLGNVLRLNSGNTDYAASGGIPITYEWESKEDYLDSRATEDVINEMGWFVDNGRGAQVCVSSDGRAFVTIGEITNRVTLFPTVNVRGHFFQYRLQGSNSGTPIVFTGFEIYDSTSLGYVRT